MASLRAARDAAGLFTTPIPERLRGHWCFLWLTGAARVGRIRRPGPARVSMSLLGDRFPPVWTDLGRLPGVLGEAATVFVLPDAETLRIDLPAEYGTDDLAVTLRPVGRVFAAIALATSQPRAFLRAMAGGGPASGVRAALAVLGTPGAPGRDYAEWVALFDSRAVASGSAPPTSLQLVVWPSASPAALAATLASLQAQSAAAPAAIRPAELAASRAEYVALLQAGETLAPDALATMDAAIAGADSPDCLFADEDALDASGRRRVPLFKPDASHTLMLSGTLTRGLWVFRREHVAEAEAGWAETARLDAWLSLHRHDRPPRTTHIPRVLAHRRADTQAAPAAALAEVVDRHLRIARLPARVVSGATYPIRVTFAAQERMAIIVPTTGRLPHVGRCLSAVLARTDAAFELLVVLSTSAPPDAEQTRMLGPILADPRARLVLAGDGPFNYARANNLAAATTSAPFLCLLNDDVEPLDPAWARAMAGHFSDARVGAVGAKLLFANRTVQHGGIVMGLSGLAGHAHRGLPRDAAGYADRASLTQEFSAVTGACMLVRASAFAELGGMDENFPVAFNDVGFCLSLRERGWGIVWSAEAELLHHESVTRGPHGSGPGAGREREAARRIRERWPEVCAADPFYNPNLSVVPGREWTPAFPPRDARRFTHPAENG